DSGIGLWVKPAPITQGPIYVLGDSNRAIVELQTLLGRFGYALNTTGQLDGTTRDAIAAFQRHFRPDKVDGVFDISTLETLKAVIAASEQASKGRQAGTGTKR